MSLSLRARIAYTCLLFLALSVDAAAEGFNLIPSIALREEYNDNVFFSVQDQSDDFITTVSPGLGLLDTTERLDLSLSGRLDAIYYADLTELDAVDQHYVGHLGYQLTERLGLLTDAWYIKDSRPDRDILETGLVQSAQPRRRKFAGLGADYRTGENTSNNLFYRYEESDFEDVDLVDSKIHTIDYQLTWDARRVFTETIGKLSLGYANADFSTSRVETFSATLGADWKATELWHLMLDLGARYTTTDFVTVEVIPPFNTLVTRTDTTSDLSGVGKATAVYDGLYTYINLAVLHDIREARGRGGTAYRTELTGWAGYRLTEKFRLTLSAGYYLNRTQQGTVAIVEVDEQTLRIRPGLQYEFTEDLILEAAYKYTRIEDDIDNTTADQNMVFAQIYWQWPIFE